MADFERRQLEIRLEFSEGPSGHMEDAQVFRVQGRQPHVLDSNYLFWSRGSIWRGASDTSIVTKDSSAVLEDTVRSVIVCGE